MRTFFNFTFHSDYTNRSWGFQKNCFRKFWLQKIVEISTVSRYLCPTNVLCIVNGRIIHFHLFLLEYAKNEVAYFSQKRFRTDMIKKMYKFDNYTIYLFSFHIIDASDILDVKLELLKYFFENLSSIVNENSSRWREKGGARSFLFACLHPLRALSFSRNIFTSRFASTSLFFSLCNVHLIDNREYKC